MNSFTGLNTVEETSEIDKQQKRQFISHALSLFELYQKQITDKTSK